jgi:hypothetical protein
MSTSQVVLVVAVLVCLAGVGVATLLLRGRMSGEAKVPGFLLRLTVRRQPDSNPGSAVIEDSRSSHGGASAIAPQRARISRTEAKGDLIARVDEVDDPKA